MSASGNVFEKGSDQIEVLPYDPATGRTPAVDRVEGFVFEMEPQELAAFLTEHDYHYAGEASQ